MMYRGTVDRPRRLAVDVAEFFGFDFQPFGALTSPEDEFLVTGAHETLLKILRRAAVSRETVSVTAEPGSGKTVSLGWGIERLRGEGIRVVCVDPTDGGAFTITKLKREIMLGLDRNAPSFTSDVRFRAIVADASRGKPFLLALDNAHGYPRRTLVALRRINEQPFAMRQRLIGIVLAGYPSLEGLLADGGELNSRITRYEMQLPRAEDIRPYIEKRLGAVCSGIVMEIFDEGALAYLEEKQSIEREPLRFGDLNISLSRALYEAAILGEKIVTESIMAEADMRPEDTRSLYERAGRPDRRAIAAELKLDRDLLYQEIEKGDALGLDDRNRVRRKLRHLISKAA